MNDRYSCPNCRTELKPTHLGYFHFCQKCRKDYPRYKLEGGVPGEEKKENPKKEPPALVRKSLLERLRLKLNSWR